jgi:hypothetical protein
MYGAERKGETKGNETKARDGTERRLNISETREGKERGTK